MPTVNTTSKKFKSGDIVHYAHHSGKAVHLKLVQAVKSTDPDVSSAVHWIIRVADASNLTFTKKDDPTGSVSIVPEAGMTRVRGRQCHCGYTI